MSCPSRNTTGGLGQTCRTVADDGDEDAAAPPGDDVDGAPMFPGAEGYADVADMPAGTEDGSEDAAAPPGADVDGAPTIPSAECPVAILLPIDVHMAMDDTALEALDTIEQLQLHTDEWVFFRLLPVREFQEALRRHVHEQFPSDDLELQAGGSLRLIDGIMLEQRPPMTASCEMLNRLYRMLLDMAVLASSRFIDQQLLMSKGTPFIVKNRWIAMFPAGYLDRTILLSRLGHSLHKVFTPGLSFKVKRRRHGHSLIHGGRRRDVAHASIWSAGDAAQASMWSAGDAAQASMWSAGDAAQASTWSAGDAAQASTWSAGDAASGDVAHASIWSAGDAAQASMWSAGDAAQASTWSANDAAAHAGTSSVPVPVSVYRSDLCLSELILSTTMVEATLTETAEFWEDSLWHHCPEGEWQSSSAAQESTAVAATTAASLMESEAEERTSSGAPAVAAAEPAAAAAPVDGSIQILAIVTDDFLIQFRSF